MIFGGARSATKLASFNFTASTNDCHIDEQVDPSLDLDG
eukprot:CAMPEP_0201726486 /NCGR_PEP_ID=MMETSP0593-20130828/9732_1 /ASSEMBLY_ACC=CAM_ASM_000672 /TAXON_ID=267983 /ORGANISM="Skeletonema japonicum, Strain CCMP2506" /LENGTH=38 /DNA_ID= /DNA_START= /DNA_END= /DNA_ORIENTATION=